MKWRTKLSGPAPRDRVRWRFFWLPESINGTTYWLCFRKVREHLIIFEELGDVAWVTDCVLEEE